MLGPLEVVDGARPLAVGPAKQKTVLALLLARANSQVSLDEIVDEVWGERPPQSATANARMYAANLRRLFAGVAGGGPAVARQGTGYMLTVAPDDFDLSCFRDLVRQAREAMSAGDPVAAVARFDEALALWRGPVLADVRGGQILSGWRAAVDDEQLSVREARIEALLAAGKLDDAVTQARELSVGAAVAGAGLCPPDPGTPRGRRHDRGAGGVRRGAAHVDRTVGRGAGRGAAPAAPVDPRRPRRPGRRGIRRCRGIQGRRAATR